MVVGCSATALQVRTALSDGQQHRWHPVPERRGGRMADTAGGRAAGGAPSGGAPPAYGVPHE
ncbi:hypothetical protein KCH_46370 [Kitasatospora cheerisanensis KCTC 2395]|uniref:Uncharacterized protein n=1 Tax=Kitasatospora cheerisanensis KCTC 2395 TaxID=1348663 RepID=A0A066YZ06_9ACTN|nr:hypothetical protein KCH_46370 [Kitasatospora cheerisanensis KCTC 2395]